MGWVFIFEGKVSALLNLEVLRIEQSRDEKGVCTDRKETEMELKSDHRERAFFFMRKVRSLSQSFLNLTGEKRRGLARSQ